MAIMIEMSGRMMAANRNNKSQKRDWLALWYLCVLCGILSAVLTSSASAQETSKWNGSTGNWSDATRWDTDFFPNNGNGGFDYNAEINGGTVTVDQDIEIEGLTFNGGTITGDFDLVLNGASTWSQGTMSGTGTTTIASDGTLLWNSNSGSILSRPFVNSGEATLQYGLNLNGTTFQNNGSFTSSPLLSAISITKSVGASQSFFINAGNFIKESSGTTTIQYQNVWFNNSGLVDVRQGELRLVASNTLGPTHTGDFSIAAGATLFLGGNHDLTSSVNITGPGTLELGESTKTFAGQLSPEGTIKSGGTFEINSTTSGGTLIHSGNLSGTGDVTFQTIDWNSGSMFGPGRTIIAPGGTLSFSNSNPVDLGRTLVNGGSAFLTNVGPVGDGFHMRDGGVLQNNGSFTFDTDGTQTITTCCSTGNQTAAFYNAGTLIKQGSGMTTITRVSASHTFVFSNTGTVDVQEGTLRLLTGAGSIHTGDFFISSGAELFLQGIHDFGATANVSGAGVLHQSSSPGSGGGTTTLAGQLSPELTVTISSGGTLNIDSTTSAETLNLSEGTLSGSGTVTFQSINWANGGMFGSGTTVVSAGGTLTFTNPGTSVQLRRTLVNNGTASITDTYVNFSEGIFQNNGEITVTENGSHDFATQENFKSSAFNNAGTFTKLGTGTTGFQAAAVGSSLPFNNTGIVDVQAGTLVLNSGVAQYSVNSLTEGTWIIRDGATLQFPAGVDITTNLADVTLDGPGSTFEMINNLANNQGSFSILNGRNFAAADEFSNSGTLTVGSSSLFTAPALSQHVGNELTGGTWHIGGVLDVVGPNITTSDADVTLDGPNSFFSQINSLIENRGRFAIKNGRNFTPTGSFTNTGTLTIGASSTFDATDGFTQTATGSVRGTGTFLGNLVNPGLLAPGNSPGIIEVDGDYVQTDEGTLEIEVQGYTPGTEHDQLQVTGTAHLAGRLEVPILQPFNPASGPIIDEPIQFLTAGTRTGEFSAIVAPNLAAHYPSLAVDVTYQSDGAQLTFAPIKTNIVFDEDSDNTADWFNQDLTWEDIDDPGAPVIPRLVHDVTIQNLVSGVQEVQIESANAQIAKLTVGGAGTDELVVTVGDGTFSPTSGNLSSTIDVNIQENGTIALNAGTVASSELKLNGGLLKGNGLVDLATSSSLNMGTLTVTSGTISPGFSVGSVNVDGNLKLETDGEIIIEATSTANRDTIAVTGEVVLEGSLTLDVTGNTLQPGDSIQFLTAESITEDLSSFEVIGNDNDLYFRLRTEDIGGGLLALSTDGLHMGDFNCDGGDPTTDDIPAFALALTNPRAYDNEFGASAASRSLDGDQDLDVDDIDNFAEMLEMTPGQLIQLMQDLHKVPEPGGLCFVLSLISILANSRCELKPKCQEK